MSAENVKLVITDVDGVLTDAGIGMDDSGREIKFFSARDGIGVKLLQRAGIPVGFLSSRASDIVRLRAESLGVRIADSGVENKLRRLIEILETEGISAREACFIGDDLVDLPCLGHVGFPVAVADACREVREVASYVTEAIGGRGAFREVAEHVLKSRRLWETVLETFR